ncbi:MAG: amidase [Halobacteriales archaeon]
MGTDESDIDITEYAARLPFEVDAGALPEYREQIAAQEEILATLDTLPTPDPPDREHWAPDEETDPLGAFLTRCAIEDDADGPLAGMTVAIKDNIAVGGVPMTCGSPLLADYVPPEDATVVTNLLAAGARIVGKANMDEFAFGRDRSTMRFRVAKNPHDPDHQPGSSSAGSGVAVGTGQVDVALGTDTGGSVRFPAAWSGVVGLKPTRGLVSHHGFVQFAKTLDTIGPLARETLPAARALAAMAGEDPHDLYTRGVSVGEYVPAVERGHETDPSELTIGIPEELWGQAPELDTVTRAALDRLADAGAELRDVSIDAYEYALPGWLGIGVTEVGAYFRANLSNYWLPALSDPSLTAAFATAQADNPDEPGSIIRSNRLFAEYLNDTHGDRYYALAQQARERVTESVDRALADVDVLASTTVPMLAPAWGEETEDTIDAVANTAPFNLTGHPALSVPCGTIDGLPVGLQFVAGHFEEATAFRAGAHWEAIYDGIPS